MRKSGEVECFFFGYVALKLTAGRVTLYFFDTLFQRHKYINIRSNSNCNFLFFVALIYACGSGPEVTHLRKKEIQINRLRNGEIEACKAQMAKIG